MLARMTLPMVVTGALIVALSIRAPSLSGDEKKKDNAKPPAKGEAKADEKLSKFMRQKLDASNEVLEGLVTEDFEMIEKGAASMKRLSAAEQWQVSNDALYRQHSNQFRRAMEKLEKSAKDKQLEAATLAWVEGTMSCLECHKWVRSNLIADK